MQMREKKEDEDNVILKQKIVTFILYARTIK